MSKTRAVTEQDLAALARRFRKQAGISRAQAARDMEVAQTSIFHAEESPQLSYFKLRTRIIEAYSEYRVESRIYLVKKKGRTGAS